MQQTVLITGASGGIGRETAHCFAKCGYRLILCCHSREDRLNELCEKIYSEYGMRPVTFAGDLGDSGFVLSIFNKLKEISLIPDIIINNAGISVTGLFTDTTPEIWDRVLRTNLTSIYNICYEAVPHMISKKSGRIINISSVWGVTGASCEVAYSASKGGINAFSKALAKELAPSGISVNAIAFGCIDTEMNGHLNEDEKNALAEEIPAGRMATPKEAADYIYSVATSPAYLTGQVLTFDGGWI